MCCLSRPKDREIQMIPNSPVDVVIGAVRHYDPLGRRRIVDLLQTQKQVYGSSPLFVAVEWEEKVFRAIETQRPHFRELISAAWPCQSEDFLDVMAASLAFDGDSHRDDESIGQTIWMDQQGTSPNDPKVLEYAEARLERIRFLVGGDTLPDDPFRALSTISEKLWTLPPDCVDLEDEGQRDRTFWATLQPHLNSSALGWGLVIVGQLHAEQCDIRLTGILKANGVNCCVTLLNTG